MIISKKIITIFLVIIICISSVATVYAAQGMSYYFTVNGKNYQNYARTITWNNPIYIQPRAYIGNTGNISHPAGHYGIMNRLFTASGKLIYQTTIKYNAGACVATDMPGPTYYQQGTYFCDGFTYVYNAKTGLYTGTQTFQTPYDTI